MALNCPSYLIFEWEVWKATKEELRRGFDFVIVSPRIVSDTAAANGEMVTFPPVVAPFDRGLMDG